MREGLTSKAAQDLRAGDVVFPTGKVIVSVQRGLRTPSGKVEVTYRNRKGELRTDVWGRYTKITVEVG